MDDQRIVLSLEITIRHELGARHKLCTYVDSHITYLHQTSSSVVTRFVMIISRRIGVQRRRAIGLYNNRVDVSPKSKRYQKWVPNAIESAFSAIGPKIRPE